MYEPTANVILGIILAFALPIGVIWLVWRLFADHGLPR